MVSGADVQGTHDFWVTAHVGIAMMLSLIHIFQQFHGTFAHGFDAEGGVGIYGRHHQVFEGCGTGEQVKVLEDESDSLVPESGAFCGVEFGNVVPGNIVMA